MFETILPSIIASYFGFLIGSFLLRNQGSRRSQS